MDLRFLWVVPLTSVVIPVSLVNVQSLWNNEIKLASYQSYISDEIANEAYDQFGIKTTYFENDKDILNGFQIGAYDLAIVSSSTLEEAIKKKIVKTIDWSKLKGIPSSFKASSQTSSSDKKFFNDNLFSPIVNKMFEDNPGLYEYGIPYFLSYLTFVYRGEQLEGVGDSWSKLLEKISQDSRFSSGKENLPKLGLIEDEVTVFSISKLIDDSGNNVVENFSKKDLGNPYEKYSQLMKKGLNLGRRGVFLNPDSALLSEMLVSGQLKGVFMYNGDALSAYQTLKEEEEDSSKDLNKEFHIFEGNPRLWLLDSIAISSKITPEREDKVHEFLNKLLFDKVLSNGQSQDTYQDSWAWKNFDFLKYTPTLKTLQEKVKSLNKSNSGVANPSEDSEYDELTIKLLFGSSDDDTSKCSADTSQENKDCPIVFERGLSDEENLNLSLSFQRWKSGFF